MNAQPGSYALILQADRRQTVRIGRLGQLTVEPGCYVYVGSALGPGGVRAQGGHHGAGFGPLFRSMVEPNGWRRRG